MLRDIITAAGQRIKRALESDRIHTLSPPTPERKTDLVPVVKTLLAELAMHQADDTMRQREAYDMAGELMEASLMCGSGPWKGQSTFAEARAPGGLQTVTESNVKVREDFFSNAQGANGLFGFEFANWEWKREINFSLLEFSRWGIQQIILISRLYYLKNPIVRRLVDVCAIYVFGRGVEVSSPDEDVNDAVKRFAARNQNVLGQSALTDLERRKDYDGNLFFAFFADQKTGETSLRMIDATEIQQIVTDPEDSDTAWFFQRMWVQRVFDVATGQQRTESQEAWYPALNYEPTDKPPKINGKDVMWDVPVYHRKCGTVGKWIFGCPRIYPMLDWAKASRKFLEACAAVKAALAQFAMTITTKGGQQALAGIKQQLETTVGTGNSSWLDQNPTAVNGSIFGSGPGTTLSAFKSSGEGGDPEEVRRYLLMCCMVKGVPETFLADVSTGNLATATSLDRPTELAFMSLQEEWREDLVIIYAAGIRNELRAPGGVLREAMNKRKVNLESFTVRESARVFDPRKGHMVYSEAAKQNESAAELMATFPSIREGDIPQLATALASAFATGTMDPKSTARKFFEYFDIEEAEDILQSMYPDATYDPDKTGEPEATPQQGGKDRPAMKEAVDRLRETLDKLRGKAA